MQYIYLDHNATTQPTDEVVAAMHAALTEYWANPSSAHRPGIAARQKVELARSSVAQLLGCEDREVVFTSGGTEAANLAIRGTLQRLAQRNVIVTSRMEHSTVRELAETLAADHGLEVIWLHNDNNGVVDLNHLEEVLQQRASDIAIVSVMWVNNETGVIQPIEEIGGRCKEHGIVFHTDATQMVGKMPMNASELPVDLLSFAAHKFHGPKGIGGLFVRRGVRVPPQIIGGPHERNRRGGTENTPGIIGLGAAADCARSWLATDALPGMDAMHRQFEKTLIERCENAVVNCADAPRLWTTSNIGFPGLEAEAVLLMLSERGVCASAGAACSSGAIEPSSVLKAAGVPDEVALGSCRFSICRHTTQDELDQAVNIIADVITAAQQISIKM